MVTATTFCDHATVRRTERGPATVSSPAIVAHSNGMDTEVPPGRLNPRTSAAVPIQPTSPVVATASAMPPRPPITASRTSRPERRTARSSSTVTGTATATTPASTATGTTSRRPSSASMPCTSWATPEVVAWA